MPAASTLPKKILLAAALSAFLLPPCLKAQISAEEQRKRDLFLRARESIVPVPASTPRSAPAKPKPRPRPVETPLPVRKSTPQPTSTPRPEPKKTPRPAPVEREKQKPEKLPPESPKKTKQDPFPVPREQKTPLTTPKPAAKDVPSAPITIEKSGLEKDQGLQPVPETERRGFFGLFGGPRYRYLTRSVRSEIDRAPVKRGRWQYIIVHNSGTRQGNARIFENYHRKVRKMKNGLAYHFVIGNGKSSGNGEIEIGSRWTRQINGGHVASDYLNNISIGICLVGDYNRDKPTDAQLAALDELIRYLRGRVGKTKGRSSIVKAHREINPKPTDCPGNRFPYRWLHRKFN